MNLNNSGIITPEFRNAAHHIVAGTARLAQDARDVLYKFGVGINDAVNGVFLPTVRVFLKWLITQRYILRTNMLGLIICYQERKVANRLLRYCKK